MELITKLLANSYFSSAPALNGLASVCTVNGQVVDCPPFLNFLGFLTFPVLLVFLLILVIAQWRIYTKAGKPGWAAIIPIYNAVVLLEIVKKPIWWIILLFIPIVNIIITLIVTHELSKSFGKGIGFTIGIILLPIIFLPILGFGKATYMGSTAEQPVM